MIQLNDWLSIDKVSGRGDAIVTLTATSNEELEAKIAKIKVSTKNIDKRVSITQTEYTPSEPINPDTSPYFWVEFEEAGGEITLEAVYRKMSDGSPFTAGKYTDIVYSFDGINWSSTVTEILMGDNTLVYLKNNSGSFNNLSYSNFQTFQYERFVFNKRAKIGGNIKSLGGMKSYAYARIFNDNQYITDASKLLLPNTTLETGCYSYMFAGCTNLVSVPQLPATTLANFCYEGMFDGCTNLVNAPLLPATTLAEGCYSGMFFGCTSLVNAPQLPATTLTDSCYADMFSGCISLLFPPQLPATNLADECYKLMFANCSTLITAPQLPATTLVGECYCAMFFGCTSLEVAPDLPATHLTYNTNTNGEWGCYREMFYGCSSLKYVRILAEGFIGRPYTTNWLSGVSSTGTLVKLSDTYITNGVDGLPYGWSVVNE